MLTTTRRTLTTPLYNLGLGYSHNGTISTLADINTRTKIGPSVVGLGLDEARLVRNSATKLLDPAIVNGKAEPISTPTLWATTPAPLNSLGLG